MTTTYGPSTCFSPSMSEIVTVLERLDGNGMTFEVIQYEELHGHYKAQMPNYVNKLRQVRVRLNGGTLTTESGALQFMKGAVSMKVDGSLAGAARGFLGAALTGEHAVKPQYSGRGEVYLEPSFSHFLMFTLDDTEMIADRGSFYCCEASLQVGVQAQKNLSAALVGGEGLFQTKISGSGVTVLQIPVPEDQLIAYQLENETLQVDGNYVIARVGNIDFSVQKSTKSLIGSVRSGEGLLHTYKGTGVVWLVPALNFVSAHSVFMPQTTP